MPTIKRFGSTKIRMYGGDHNPPHVHVIGTAFAAQVAIADGEVLNGALPGATRTLVARWIGENRELLQTMWDRLADQG